MECTNCHSKNPDGAKFCSQCGTSLAVETHVVEKHEPAYAERRQLTVLFSDLVGSTSLSERLDPEDLRSIIRDYQAACTSVIGLFDGYVAKYLGDGVLVYFGFPVAHEDDARRAIEAGLGILEAMQSVNERYEKEVGVPIQVRIGIHTGVVVVGDMDSNNALESKAITGQTPNFAARIQSVAEPNTVLVSNETNKLTRGYFESIDLGAYELKGFSQAVHLFRINHASTARSRLDAALGELTPFAGRKLEIETLHDTWHRAQAGEAQVLLLGGEAGVGKSRLVYSLKEYASHNTESWLTELRCSPFHQNSSLYPVIDFLERIALRFDREDSPQDKLTKIAGFVTQYGLNTTEAVPLLAALLSVPLSGNFLPLSITPQRQKQLTIETLITILLHRSNRQPVLFVFEDLHWADPSSLELLDRFIERCEHHKILALLTYRPEFKPYWEPRPLIRTVDLKGLSRNDASEIILRVAENKKLPKEVIDYVISKTDGIPLFLEELTKSMLESNILIDHGDHYDLSGPFHTLGVPPTIQDSLTARLDRMTDAKPVAQLAATIGREFSYEMLEAIPGGHRNEMRSHLNRLVQAGILFQSGLPPNATYTFKHALIQDSAYSSLLKTSRKDYHKLIAEAIETHSPELIQTQPELIAQHYTKAGVNEKAIQYWLMAGYRALQRSANVEATSHFREGLLLSSKIAEQSLRDGFELQLYSAIGPALIAMKGFGAAEVGDNYEKAAAISGRMGNGVHLFLPVWGQALYRLLRGDPAKCQELCFGLLQMGIDANDNFLQVVGNAFLGNAEFWMGQFVASREHESEAIRLYDYQKHSPQAYLYGQDMGVTAHCYNMLSAWCLGNIAESDASIYAAKQIVASMQHPFSTCWAHNFVMTVQNWNENYDATINEADILISISQEQAYPFWIPIALAQKGWALGRLGDPASGIPLIEQGLAVWEMMGAILVTPLMYGWYVDTLRLNGDFDKAIAAAEKGIAMAKEIGELSSEIYLHRAKGEVYTKMKKHSEAEESLRLALHLARQQGAKSMELKVAASLYELVHDRSQSEAALNDLKNILKFYPEQIDKPFLQRIRTLVRESG